MNAKEYFERVSCITISIKSKVEQIKSLESLCAYASPSLESRGPMLHHSMLEDCVVKIADIKARLQMEQRQLLDLLLEAKSIIDNIRDERYRVILEQRYILCKSMKETMAFMGIGSTSYCRLLETALKMADKIIKNAKIIVT